MKQFFLLEDKRLSGLTVDMDHDTCGRLMSWAPTHLLTKDLEAWRRPDLVKIMEALSPENGSWSDSYAPGYCADEECSDREAFCKLLLKAAISLKGKLP